MGCVWLGVDVGRGVGRERETCRVVGTEGNLWEKEGCEGEGVRGWLVGAWLERGEGAFDGDKIKLNKSPTTSPFLPQHMNLSFRETLLPPLLTFSRYLESKKLVVWPNFPRLDYRMLDVQVDEGHDRIRVQIVLVCSLQEGYVDARHFHVGGQVKGVTLWARWEVICGVEGGREEGG